MAMRTRLVLVLALSCSGMSRPIAADEPSSLSDAQAAIESNLSTSEGKAYDQKLGGELMQKHFDTLKQCKQREKAAPESFWMLLRLSATGQVKELLLRPTTPMGICARAGLLEAKFTPPPHGGYWVGVFLKLAH